LNVVDQNAVFVVDDTQYVNRFAVWPCRRTSSGRSWTPPVLDGMVRRHPGAGSGLIPGGNVAQATTAPASNTQTEPSGQ